jgi:hypothetical protein
MGRAGRPTTTPSTSARCSRTIPMCSRRCGGWWHRRTRRRPTCTSSDQPKTTCSCWRRTPPPTWWSPRSAGWCGSSMWRGRWRPGGGRHR